MYAFTGKTNIAAEPAHAAPGDFRTFRERLRRSADVFPGKAAFIYDDVRISYQEVQERTSALAAMLADAGVRKGDKVGCLGPKTPEAMLCHLAIMECGGVFFPLDCNMPRETLHSVLEQAQPRALFVAAELAGMLQNAQDAPEPAATFFLGAAMGGAGRRSYAEHETYMSRPAAMPAIIPDDPAYLNYTSGTTGRPKAAVTTHANMDANTIAAVRAFGFTEEDVHLCMFPAFVHPHEIYARPIFLGGTAVLLDGVRPKTIAKALHEHKVTTLMAVASIYETLVRLPSLTGWDFSSLRAPESGGMHVTPALRQAFAERFGLPIQAVWGSTETAGVALTNRMKDNNPRDLEAPPGSVGRPCPGYQAIITNESGQEADPGQVGELLIRGPAVCHNYLTGHGELVPVTDAQGWFHTGDVMCQGEDGFFYFKCRISGMMKVGGIKVYPIEIENVIRAHPDVAEAAVVKNDDALHGEIPKAFVVAKEGRQLTAADIRKWCSRRLHRYRTPRLVEIIDELPRTPGGKVAWKKLSSAC